MHNEKCQELRILIGELDIKRSTLGTCESAETWFHSAVPDLLTNLNKLICFHMMRIVGSCRKILTEIHLNDPRLSFIRFVGSSIAFGADLRTLQFFLCRAIQHNLISSCSVARCPDAFTASSASTASSLPPPRVRPPPRAGCEM